MAIMKNMKCRICKDSVEELKNNPFFPFCSERCKTIDLGRWLTGDYSISEPLIEMEDEYSDPASEED